MYVVKITCFARLLMICEEHSATHARGCAQFAYAVQYSGSSKEAGDCLNEPRFRCSVCILNVCSKNGHMVNILVQKKLHKLLYVLLGP